MRVSRPPDITRLGSDNKAVLRLLTVIGDPELEQFLSKANAEYYSWEELRRRPLPVGLLATEAWAALKLSRGAKRTLPLIDVNGKPFSYWLPEAAAQMLHQIDRTGGGLTGFDLDQPDLLEGMKDRILIDSHMEEAIATSQIEGAVTTRQRAKEMLRSGRRATNRSEQMILNGYRTIHLLRERAGDPLTIDMLHDMQRSMTEGTLDDASAAGRFRSPADPPVQVIVTRDNEVVFTPPPAEQLEQRMRALILFANEPLDAQPFMHPFVRGAMLHFWLAYEHPYSDGNGRTARALFYWYMLKSGYWLFEFLTISRIIIASRMKYYQAFLDTETDDNDLTYFLMHQLDVTRRALQDLHERLRELTAQQQRMASIRRVSGLNVRQRALLDHALRHPHQVYTFESHRRSHDVTYQTARTDLLGMARQKLLERLPVKKPMQFVPSSNLRQMLKQPSQRR